MLGQWGNVEAVAEFIRSNNLILHYDEDPRLISLWSPHRKLPIKLRRAVFKHRDNLALLMQQADIRLCPSRDLHRQFYVYRGAGIYQCAKCAELEKFMLN